MSKYFVTCARGVEEITEAELRGLGVARTEKVSGGVFFEGEQTDLYRAHLWLRTGNRILLILRSFPVKTPDELYENLSKFKWETFLTPGLTFAVDCTISGRNSIQLNHSHYARLKAKDAIVDRLRDKTGDRPDVNTENPDVRVVLYIRDGVCTLNMDATGDPLHERGYRARQASAPLKETLAASILKFSGWQPGLPIVDPMCGSGTLLAEAALMAANIAPGSLRARFAFMNWPDFHRARWEELVKEAQAKQMPIPAGIFFGSDKDSEAVRQARQAFQVLGLSESISLEQKRFEDFQPPATEMPGWIVMNPPYGDRLGEVQELKPLYKTMGDIFKQRCPGWKAAVFTGSAELMKEIGLKTKRKIPLWNGPIECRLLTYEMYAGSAKKADAQLSHLEFSVLEPARGSVHSINKFEDLFEAHFSQLEAHENKENLCAYTIHSMMEKGLLELYPDFHSKIPLSLAEAEHALTDWTEEGFASSLKLGILATEKGRRLFSGKKGNEPFQD